MCKWAHAGVLRSQRQTSNSSTGFLKAQEGLPGVRGTYNHVVIAVHLEEWLRRGLKRDPRIIDRNQLVRLARQVEEEVLLRRHPHEQSSAVLIAPKRDLGHDADDGAFLLVGQKQIHGWCPEALLSDRSHRLRGARAETTTAKA